MLLPRRCDIQLDTWLVARKLFDKGAPGTALRNAYGFDARQVVALGGAHQHRAGKRSLSTKTCPGMVPRSTAEMLR